MSKKLEVLLEEYSESHRNSTNKLIHWICVPLIFWAIVALLYSIPNVILVNLLGDYFFSNWAVLIMLPVLIYYLILSVSTAVGMLFFIGACLYISELLFHCSCFPLWRIALIVFVLAWIGQFYGHKIEGKKPDRKSVV